MTRTGGVGRRQAISTLAQKFDIPSKQVYGIIEKSKRSGD
jgi:hypothetical protein